MFDKKMSTKLWLIFVIISMLSYQTFGSAISQRFRRSPNEEQDKPDDIDSDDHDHDDQLPDGIKLGSQQSSQSNSENVGNDKSRGIQQHNQGQQQLAAMLGGKHYLLQQQTSMGQQLAKLGKKTAIQQLADAQKQAVDNGKVKKEAKSGIKDNIEDNNDKDER